MQHFTILHSNDDLQWWNLSLGMKSLQIRRAQRRKSLILKSLFCLIKAWSLSYTTVKLWSSAPPSGCSALRNLIIKNKNTYFYYMSLCSSLISIYFTVKAEEVENMSEAQQLWDQQSFITMKRWGRARRGDPFPALPPVRELIILLLEDDAVTRKSIQTCRRRL